MFTLLDVRVLQAPLSRPHTVWGRNFAQAVAHARAWTPNLADIVGHDVVEPLQQPLSKAQDTAVLPKLDGHAV